MVEAGHEADTVGGRVGAARGTNRGLPAYRLLELVKGAVDSPRSCVRRVAESESGYLLPSCHSTADVGNHGRFWSGMGCRFGGTRCCSAFVDTSYRTMKRPAASGPGA